MISLNISWVLVLLMSLYPLLSMRSINKVLSSSMNRTALMIASTCLSIILDIYLIRYINYIPLLLLWLPIMIPNVGSWLRPLPTTIDVDFEPSNRLVPHSIQSSLFLLSKFVLLMNYLGLEILWMTEYSLSITWGREESSDFNFKLFFYIVSLSSFLVNLLTSSVY